MGIAGAYSYVVISVDVKGYAWDGLTVYKGIKRISQQPWQGYFKESLETPEISGTMANESDSEVPATSSKEFMNLPDGAETTLTKNA
ncbi:hypothetical protein ACU60T_24990 [Klebsiella aerogenes]